METLKPKNQSSLGASIGSALSGATGTDGATYLNHTAQTVDITLLDEKTESSTTLDRGLRYLP